jgi:predicted solute-binding protein
MQNSVFFKESALLAKTLIEGKTQIALLPTMDLLRHKDIFVSPTAGISFDGSISNSYFYFAKGTKAITNLVLAGDISSVEAILARIAIHEMYDENVNVTISQKPTFDGTQNTLLSGDENFKDSHYLNGLDFAEEISEITGMPFVHYVFAATEKEALLKFGKRIQGIEQNVYSIVENPEWKSKFSEETNAFIRENIQHVIYEFDSSDTQGIEQMIQLVYFHGIIQDIFDIKYAR